MKKSNSQSDSYLFSQKMAAEALKSFFEKDKAEIDSFGQRVNQTFEAFTFASVIKWYKQSGWKIKIKNPKEKGREIFKLKFSTHGAPEKYSYAICEKDDEKCQIRHQLRIDTYSYKHKNKSPSNMCCDVTVIKDQNLEYFSSNDSVLNEDMITFGEVKHMSAFAELIAGFIGMVHELQPNRLKSIRRKNYKTKHLAPFLSVSGILYRTARGAVETIRKRKYDIDVYSHNDPFKF